MSAGGSPDWVDETSDWALTAEPAEADSESEQESAKPGRSTIRFPYTDLRDAARVPAVIKNNFGSACDIDQLAGQFQQSARSGSFRTRIAAAVAFGLVTSRKNRVAVTPLGHQAAAGDRKALAEAFLNIELYRKVYEQYRGTTLPADPGLTAEIQALGVLETQADRARQVLQRSADYAGFFEAGRDRLIMPPTGRVEEPRERQKGGHPAGRDEGNGGGQNMANNPLLQGLWGMLPTEGDFPAERRAQWFRALAVNLDLVYGDGHIDLTIKRTEDREYPTHDG